MVSLKRSKADLSVATLKQGIALPAALSPGGPFEAKSPEDTLWGDILQAIFTPRGSRAMRRQYGSGVGEILFSPLVDDPAIVHYAIASAVGRSAPRARILSTNVRVDAASNSIEVNIAYADARDPNPQKRRVFVSRSTVGPF